MRRCVGNLAAETASLRMRSGQGVGGRVLATREPCSIEDYLQNNVISSDFFDLARAERVRSALAVPLVAQEEIIGVLQVWRRKPSRFTPQHTAELATLANLASLAIENIKLAEARELAARELKNVHAELKARYDVIQKSTQLQECLVSTLLAGGNMTSIARTAHERIGFPVAVLDRQTKLQSCHPPLSFPAEIRQAIAVSIALESSDGIQCGTGLNSPRAAAFQRVMAGSEHLGWVVLLDADPAEPSTTLFTGAISVTVAMHLTKTHAAARALSDKLASLMWDLTNPSESLRSLALERAKELGVDLDSELCVLAFQIDGLERPGKPGQADRELEARRRGVADAPAKIPGGRRWIRLSALRGGELIVIAAFRNASQIKATAAAILVEIERGAPGCSVGAGIGRPVVDPLAIPAGVKQARVAAAVARQSSSRRVVSFTDSGVAGMLMSLRDDADFRDFVGDKLGSILSLDEQRRDLMLKTLDAFFSENCSQQGTARRLRIHQKTVAYRLNRIEALTGVDLALHENRVTLSLAVKMHELLR